MENREGKYGFNETMQSFLWNEGQHTNKPRETNYRISDKIHKLHGSERTGHEGKFRGNEAKDGLHELHAFQVVRNDDFSHYTFLVSRKHMIAPSNSPLWMIVAVRLVSVTEVKCTGPLLHTRICA